MPYTTNKEIEMALQVVKNWVKNEGGEVRSSAVVRQLIKNSRQNLPIREDILIAAFGLLILGVEPNAADVAWFVRDGQIGFPTEPSFDFCTV